MNIHAVYEQANHSVGSLESTPSCLATEHASGQMQNNRIDQYQSHYQYCKLVPTSD